MTNEVQTLLAQEAGFLAKLKAVASSLSVNYEWLVAVMWNESRLRPYAKNSKSGAFGLIQFMPSTMASMGISEALLRSKTATDQLQYVQKYLQPYKGKIKDVYDLYAAVFFPVLIGKPVSYVLETSRLSASLIAKSNPLFDLDKNSRITKLEFMRYIEDVLLPQVGVDGKKKVKS